MSECQWRTATRDCGRPSAAQECEFCSNGYCTEPEAVRRLLDQLMKWHRYYLGMDVGPHPIQGTKELLRTHHRLRS